MLMLAYGSYNRRSYSWEGSRYSPSIYSSRERINRRGGNQQRRSYTRFLKQTILHTSTRQNSIILLLIPFVAVYTPTARNLTTMLTVWSVLTFRTSARRSVPTAVERSSSMSATGWPYDIAGPACSIGPNPGAGIGGAGTGAAAGAGADAARARITVSA